VQTIIYRKRKSLLGSVGLAKLFYFLFSLTFITLSHTYHRQRIIKRKTNETNNIKKKESINNGAIVYMVGLLINY
jgi:hypothetical protein